MARQKKSDVETSVNQATGTITKKLKVKKTVIDPPAVDTGDESAEFAAAKEKFEKVDGITQYIRDFFDAPLASHVEDFADTRLPHLKDKSLLKVKRFYPMVKAIVDMFPKGTDEQDIQAKKWEFERLGYKYAWVCEGEDLSENPEEFGARFNPMETMPTKRILFNTSLADGVRF